MNQPKYLFLEKDKNFFFLRDLRYRICEGSYKREDKKSKLDSNYRLEEKLRKLKYFYWYMELLIVSEEEGTLLK